MTDINCDATSNEKHKAVCSLCGEPMPPGEEMFKYHGYSGDCPKPPLPKTKEELETVESLRAERDAAIAKAEKAEAAHIEGCRMGLEVAAKHIDINIEPPCECIIKWDADIKSEWYFTCWCKDITSIRASEIWCQCKNKADRIRALDPAQIVKERE